MTLYPTKQRQSITAQTKQQLDDAFRQGHIPKRRNHEELIALHIKYIRATTIAKTKAKYAYTWSSEQIDSMKSHAAFAVPETASHGTNKTYHDIIAAAGCPPSSSIGAETEAAAAWRFDEMVTRCRVNGEPLPRYKVGNSRRATQSRAYV